MSVAMGCSVHARAQRVEGGARVYEGTVERGTGERFPEGKPYRRESAAARAIKSDRMGKRDRPNTTQKRETHNEHNRDPKMGTTVITRVISGALHIGKE